MAPEAHFTAPGFADKARFLCDGAHLGEPGVPVERVETHFACVFLTPQHAFKLRKPVRCGGVDTRELRARRASCDEELRLNAALAPGVYLQVMPLLLGPGGRMELRPASAARPAAGWRVVDWLLKMRRLPADRMLDRVILARSVVRGDLEAVGRHLDLFYAGQPGLPVGGDEYCRRLREGIRDNRDAILAGDGAGIDRPAIERVARLQEEWLDAHRSLLGRRAELGAIRDCHGDLKPEHICLGPPVRIIDRLDFDASLRRLDPVEDMALLWLECRRLGDSGTGEWLVSRHVEASDAGLPASVLHFYVSNRALTRARIAVWRLAEAGVDLEFWRLRLCSYVECAGSAIEQALRQPSSSSSAPRDPLPR
jgi:aminoglycoside phosphotransferase family enzyme